ncbi:ATP-binding protein [Dyadobacter sp. CY261]|uniref:sensor histidine kinase n=1 Tax=Dyadobacter sp. CY261 TaxID=2907203 RepID=UPI001F2E1C09
MISNALKFIRPVNPVVAQISSRLVQGSQSGFDLADQDKGKDFQLIEVADNGIGFDPKYSQQIFEVFRRLHGKSEFAGTGRGLSIVKKVVDAHEGYVQAIGKPGEDATFQLLIPI